MLFIKSSICTIYAYSDFFLVCKLCLLFQTILDLWPVLILEIFSCWDINKGQFRFLVTFLVVFFLVCKLWKSGPHIITYFKHGKYFIWGFLVFNFLVFSVFKYLKFSFSSNFSCSGNVKVLVCKYIYQVCKLYFYFGHVRNFGQYLYLSVFNKQWKCPTFSFS